MTDNVTQMMILAARREKALLIKNLTKKHMGYLGIKHNESYDEIKIRALVDRVQMNGIHDIENIKFIIDAFLNRSLKNRVVIRMSRLLLDPFLSEDQKMIEIMSVVNGSNDNIKPSSRLRDIIDNFKQ